MTDEPGTRASGADAHADTTTTNTADATERGPIDIVDVPEESRYEARVNGELAGFAVYRRRPDAVVFPHTEVDPGYEGRGVGSALAKRALDDVRANGGAVIPRCSFIAAYIRRHDGYADLVAPRYRAEFDAGAPGRP